MDVRLPDGTIIKNVPDGISKADLTAKLQANGYDISKLTAPAPTQPSAPAPSEVPGPRQERSFLSQVGQQLGNVAAGAVRGAGSIGATLIRPFESAQENEARRRAMDEVLASAGAEPESFAYGAGKIGAEIAGTAGIGGGLAAPLKLAARVAPSAARVATPVASALSSGGLTAPTTLGKIAAGSTVGAAGAGLIEPDSAATGAVLGAAAPFVPGLVAKGVGKIADLRQLPTQRAAKIARATLGQDIQQTVNALRSAPANASVAEVTAGIQNPAWQALVADSLEKTPTGAQYLNKFATMTNDEAVNALSKLAGGGTAAEARATTEVAKKNLNTITGPMRESAISRANLGKEVARLEGLSAELGEQAAAKVQEVRRLMELGDIANANARLNLIKRNLPVGLTKYTYGGELADKAFNEWSSKAAQASLDLGQGARFAQGAANALRSVGIKPLEGTQLAQRISAVSRNQEFAGNDLIEGSVNQIADDIAKWTGSGGVIDANALEAIRKNSVNAAIAKLRPGMDATSQRNAAAGVLSRVKPMIDDAIEEAGGAGWRDYLTRHSEGMQKIAEKQLSGEALRLWKTDKDAFVRLVQNESPEAVEKILGPGKYNIATELAEDTLGTLQSITDRRLNQMAASKQASEGTKALATVVRQNTSSFRLPSWLNFWASATNKTLGEVQERIGNKSMKVLEQAMQSPQSAANLLESLPAAERSRILKIVGNPAAWSKSARGAVTGGVASGTSNMMAPDRAVENELVR